MKVVRFLHDHCRYLKSEFEKLSEEDANVRINAGVAESVEYEERQPDMRAVNNVDDQDRVTKIETRIVSHELQRNVELTPTKAGGNPNDEAHLTEEEEAWVKAAKEGKPRRGWRKLPRSRPPIR